MQRAILINPPDWDQPGLSNPSLGLLYLAGSPLQTQLFGEGAVRRTGAIRANAEIAGLEAILPLPPAAAMDHLSYANLHEFVCRFNHCPDDEAAALADGDQGWTTEGRLRAAGRETRWNHCEPPSLDTFVERQP